MTNVTIWVSMENGNGWSRHNLEVEAAPITMSDFDMELSKNLGLEEERNEPTFEATTPHGIRWAKFTPYRGDSYAIAIGEFEPNFDAFPNTTEA